MKKGKIKFIVLKFCFVFVSISILSFFIATAINLLFFEDKNSFKDYVEWCNEEIIEEERMYTFLYDDKSYEDEELGTKGRKGIIAKCSFDEVRSMRQDTNITFWTTLLDHYFIEKRYEVRCEPTIEGYAEWLKSK